jgi:uncharacterized membrane protein
MVMNLVRLLRHLSTPRWRIRRAFSSATLHAIERAIREAEATHDGQICFAIEAALEILPLLQGVSARERALEVFAQRRVWDTEHNNGVLIYLLLADRDVEIVADRGIHRHVGNADWEHVCRKMEAEFRDGRFEAGVLAGIDAVSHHLAHHFPRRRDGANEISDRPIIL